MARPEQWYLSIPVSQHLVSYFLSFVFSPLDLYIMAKLSGTYTFKLVSVVNILDSCYLVKIFW